MDYLPLFADLKQRPVLIVGGGEVAARKIELLHRAGAQVWVVAQTLSSELEQQYQDGRIHWLAQDFLPEQLDNVFLVIAATNDTVLNAAVFAAADQRCILANVVDDQPFVRLFSLRLLIVHRWWSRSRLPARHRCWRGYCVRS